MHELQVTPLLMHKGSTVTSKSRQRSHQRLKRGSQSFDDCGGEEYSSRQYKPTRAYHRQRSNPNILDLIPPPPPLYAPSSDSPYFHEADNLALGLAKKSSSKSQRSSAFKPKHINDRRDSDTSEYFTQVGKILTAPITTFLSLFYKSY